MAIRLLKLVFFGVYFFLMVCFLYGQVDVPLPSEKEISDQIEPLVARLADIEAQITTLEMYTPEKSLDFSDLEKVNQLMEQLDFNRRKSQLLTSQFKLLEEEFFPLFVKLVRQNKKRDDILALKIAPYIAGGEKSIYFVRQKLNHVLRQVERQEAKLQELQWATHNQVLEEERKKAPAEASTGAGVSVTIDQLQEEVDNFNLELADIKDKLAKFTAQEVAATGKMTGLQQEINHFKKISQSATTKVESLVYNSFATVREIRLNGLEIPRLNTIKTSKYLTTVFDDTLEQKIATNRSKIESLQKFRQGELFWKLFKGVGVIFIAIFCVFLLIRISRRVVRNVVGRIEGNQNIDAHHKQRYHTLSSIILSFIKAVVFVLAVLWVLGQLEINYSPFLVAAGGISLAIAFGAQSLVKDVVSGFFMLMEEQFLLGDNVDINGLSGTIEKISLRTVRIRALDGTLHTIPNGNITYVSNKTYIWSRMLVNVGTSYTADPRKVLEILTRVACDMAQEEQWKEQFLDVPEAQGILAFGAAAVEYRLIAKTRTGSQWVISREMMIRIKLAFDQAGIEIPSYWNVNIVDNAARIPADKI